MTDQSTPQKRTLGAKFRDIGMDTVAAGAGIGSITYGTHLIYHPAAFIIGGAFLLTGAWLAARKSAPE